MEGSLISGERVIRWVPGNSWLMMSAILATRECHLSKAWILVGSLVVWLHRSNLSPSKFQNPSYYSTFPAWGQTHHTHSPEQLWPSCGQSELPTGPKDVCCMLPIASTATWPMTWASVYLQGLPQACHYCHCWRKVHHCPWLQHPNFSRKTGCMTLLCVPYSSELL